MRNRVYDHLRHSTVLLVVLYHVIFVYNGVAPELSAGPFRSFQPQDAFLYFVYPWFMILLFVVSGACAWYALEKYTARQFAAARTRRLLVPSTVGLFAFHWILGWFSMQLYGAAQTMPDVPAPVLYFIMALSGTGPLWYIQLLWLFSMLLLAVRRLEKGRLAAKCAGIPLYALAALAVPLCGAAQILNTPVITVYRCGVYGLAFFLGYFVFSHDAVLERLARRWKPLCAAAAVLGVCYTVYYFGEDYCTDPVVNHPFSIMYAWIAALAAFAAAKRFGGQTGTFFRFMKKYGFGIYVFHYLPLTAAVYLIGQPQRLPSFLCYPILGIAAVSGSIILYEVISRIPVLRWCVLGIKKEKSHVSR